MRICKNFWWTQICYYIRKWTLVTLFKCTHYKFIPFAFSFCYFFYLSVFIYKNITTKIANNSTKKFGHIKYSDFTKQVLDIIEKYLFKNWFTEFIESYRDEIICVNSWRIRGSKDLFVVLFIGPDLRKSSENLVLLLLRPSVLKGYVNFLGAAEYLIHRETKLRESCRLRTGRCGNAVQTRLWTHKDLYKT